MGVLHKTLVDETGKVLIPKSIREKFGIYPNSEVIIEISQDEIIIKPFSKKSIASGIISMNLPVFVNYIKKAETYFSKSPLMCVRGIPDYPSMPYLRLNLSTRPAVSTNFCLPV